MFFPKTLAASAAVALSFALVPAANAAPTESERCGGRIGKSIAALNSSMDKEAARLCGTQNDRPTVNRLTRATNKYNKAIDKHLTNYGDEQCPTVGPVVAASVIEAVEDMAAALCNPDSPDLTPVQAPAP